MRQTTNIQTKHIPRLLEQSKYGRLCSLAQFAMAAILLPFVAQALPFGNHPGFIAQANAQEEPNPNCTLLVPAKPLTAEGLATPYRLIGCDQKNLAQSAFVQAAVIESNGHISIYNPLVVNEGDKPDVDYVPPAHVTLPARARVAIWMGFNGQNLTLKGTEDNTLADSKCVNGLPGGDNFGQMAYCNAPAFFRVAHRALRSGKLVPPDLGTYYIDHVKQTCPSTRDFSVVDQDPNDNVPTTYLVSNGKLAQDTQANRALPGVEQLINPSDERLLAVALDNALGCQPWKADNLADPGGPQVPALPLNEIQAKVRQAKPIARVPARDPMVLSNGEPNLDKLNAYRRGVFQRPVRSLEFADTTRYCRRLFRVAPARFNLDAKLTKAAPSPDPAAANSLFTFLAQRFVATDAILGCSNALGVVNPVSLVQDDQGVTTDATINLTVHNNNLAKLAPAAPADDQQAQREATTESPAATAPAAETPATEAAPVDQPTTAAPATMPAAQPTPADVPPGE